MYYFIALILECDDPGGDPTVLAQNDGNGHLCEPFAQGLPICLLRLGEEMGGDVHDPGVTPPGEGAGVHPAALGDPLADRPDLSIGLPCEVADVGDLTH